MTNDRNDRGWWRVEGGGRKVEGGGLMGNRFVSGNEKLLHLQR